MGKRLAAIAFIPFSLGALPSADWPESMPVRVGSGNCESGPVYRARIARSDSERERGLSRRVEPLAPDEAMLFVWDQPTSTRFWMKETLIPLTILFFAENGRLLSSSEMGVESDPSRPIARYSPGRPFGAALEIAPGAAPQFSVANRHLLCVEEKHALREGPERAR